jgi:Domain of unknown function (DUF4157)
VSEDFERDVKHVRGRPRVDGADTRDRRPLLSALGNKAAGRILRSLRGSVGRSAVAGAMLDETVSRAIHAKRGRGQPLDVRAEGELGAAMGRDFSDVQVHTDPEADRLNRDVRADAFTTGRDIFFRDGKYDPGSNEGRKLLAHELTHVVQQRDAPPKQDLTLSDPGDASERQASAVADAVTSKPAPSAASVARQEAPAEEEEEGAARQAVPGEEEEEAATQAAPGEEEEEAATSRADRQAAPEEEEEPAA